MKIQNRLTVFAGISCLILGIICIRFLFFPSATESFVLCGDSGDIEAISLYAHNEWFQDGEFQKKEVTDPADIQAVAEEVLGIRCRSRISLPDDLGGGWMMYIEFHYQNGETEPYGILLDGSEQIGIYFPSDKTAYGIWPDGNTFWDRIQVPAEIISEKEMPQR